MTINAIELTLGIAVMVVAVFLVIAVLLQSGKDKRLSGSITGGSSDTFFGKTKGRQKDKILSRLTAVFAIVFGALVVAMYVIVSGMYPAA